MTKSWILENSARPGNPIGISLSWWELLWQEWGPFLHMNAQARALFLLSLCSSVNGVLAGRRMPG